jgi:hypothetical protein
MPNEKAHRSEAKLPAFRFSDDEREKLAYAYLCPDDADKQRRKLAREQQAEHEADLAAGIPRFPATQLRYGR